MNATHITALRELTSRSANGVQVRLLWAEPEGRCSVAVTDITTAEAFQIESAPANGRSTSSTRTPCEPGTAFGRPTAPTAPDRLIRRRRLSARR